MLNKLEINAIELLRSLNENNNLAVSFSGGKDSLVALDLAERAGIKKAVFVNTSIEFSETIDYIEKVKNFFSIQIDTVFPKISFFDIVEKIATPSRRFRWCCDVLKFAPLAEYASEHNITGYITGLRSSESHRRLNYQFVDNNPLLKTKQINPIINWEESHIWRYIQKYSLPLNPLYETFGRIGCWCCPYNTDNDWQLISKHFPEKMAFLKNILNDLSDRHNISNKHMFVEQFGWTKYMYPTKRNTVALMTLCSSTSTYFYEGTSEIDVEKIIQLIGIISDNYTKIGRKLRIKSKVEKVKVRILIEKALNCIGCGACTSICPESALSIQDNHITVDLSKCNHCYECLNTQILRGACIMRNYNPRRYAVAYK